MQLRMFCFQHSLRFAASVLINRVRRFTISPNQNVYQFSFADPCIASARFADEMQWGEKRG